LAALLAFPASLFAQAGQEIIIPLRTQQTVCRLDGTTDMFIAASSGIGNVRSEIIQYPGIAAPQFVRFLTTNGGYYTGDVSLTTAQPVLTLGPALGHFLCVSGGITEHFAVVGDFSSNASNSYLELKSTQNDGSLDQFVSEMTSSHWTDVCFGSDAATYWKYAICDPRGVGTLSHLWFLDVTNFRSIQGGPGTGVDPGFDPNQSGNGPPYSQIPVLFLSFLSDRTKGTSSDVMYCDTFTSPTTGIRYAVAAYDVICDPMTGMQGFSLDVHNFSSPTNAQVANAACITLQAPEPTLRNMRVYGNFAVLAQAATDINGDEVGGWTIINLRQWEATGWLATTVESSGTIKGLDAIGTNMGMNKLYIGSTNHPIGTVWIANVNFAALTGGALVTPLTPHDLLTSQEKNQINPPSRPYPGGITPVTAGNPYGPFAPGNPGGGGGCTARATEENWGWLIPVLGILALAAGLKRLRSLVSA